MRETTKRMLLSLCLCLLYCSACSGTSLTRDLIATNTSIVQATLTPPLKPYSGAVTAVPSCWPINQSTLNIRGSFVFQSLNAKGQIFAKDISSFHTQLIGVYPEELTYDGSHFHVSPDGNNLAKLDKENRVVVISQDQIRTYQLPDRSVGAYHSDVEYLLDGRILIRVAEEHLLSGYQEHVGITAKYSILDPATGALDDFSVFYPIFG